MAKISWQYIAGFVDGEGSFYTTGKGSRVRASFQIAQTEEHVLVLDKIADFLIKKNIDYSFQYYAQRGSTKPYYVVAINAQDSLKKFIEGIFDYLIIKRADAEASLEFLAVKKRQKEIKSQVCPHGHPKIEENRYTPPNRPHIFCCRMCRDLRSRKLNPADFTLEEACEILDITFPNFVPTFSI